MKDNKNERSYTHANLRFLQFKNKPAKLFVMQELFEPMTDDRVASVDSAMTAMPDDYVYSRLRVRKYTV